VTARNPTLLSEEEQRALYDAFHLQVRYDRAKHQVTLHVTIYAEAVAVRTKKISDSRDETTAARSHVVSAPGGPGASGVSRRHDCQDARLRDRSPLHAAP
jgi:hypothetical protein